MTALEAAVVGGNLANLTAEQRMTLYVKRCESVGLNPFSQPFDYIELDGKLTLYANKGCTDQLRNLNQIDAKILSSGEWRNIYRVIVQVTDMHTGRSVQSAGLVPLVKEGGAWKTSQNGKRYLERDGTFSDLPPIELCNAVMKAETKAYRRATLALLGLSILDESELDTIPDARPVVVNQATGEIAAPEQPAANTAVAPPPPATARSFYTCSQCHTTIQAYKKRDGSLLSAKSIAESSVEQFHAQLCLDCARKVKAGTLVLDMPGEGDADDEGDEIPPGAVNEELMAGAQR